VKSDAWRLTSTVDRRRRSTANFYPLYCSRTRQRSLSCNAEWLSSRAAAREEDIEPVLRRRGCKVCFIDIPNAYSRNGTLCFEWPDGTITQEDPFVEENGEGTSAD